MENLLETTFKRLEKHFNTNECAFISACRSENSPEINNKLTNELANDLRKLGYGYIKVKGGYIETLRDGTKKPVEEKTFAIFNNNNESFENFPSGYKTDFVRDMIALCRKYNQDSVLIKEKNQPGHYYNQSGETFENFNTITKDNIEEYFTRLRNTKFKFIEADESDNKENYSRYNQTFGTKVERSLFFADMCKNYPDLYKK